MPQRFSVVFLPDANETDRFAVYRGTDRYSPVPIENRSLKHPLNAALIRYMSASDGDEVEEIELARAVAQAYCQYYRGRPPRLIEIIQVCMEGKHPIDGAKLLGLDLSNGEYSVLPWIRPASANPCSDVLQSLERKYLKHLNRNGLFDDKALAERCLDYIREVNSRDSAGLFEHEKTITTLKVVSVYHVPFEWQPEQGVSGLAWRLRVMLDRVIDFLTKPIGRP